MKDILDLLEKFLESTKKEGKGEKTESKLESFKKLGEVDKDCNCIFCKVKKEILNVHVSKFMKFENKEEFLKAQKLFEKDNITQSEIARGILKNEKLFNSVIETYREMMIYKRFYELNEIYKKDGWDGIKKGQQL